MALVKNNQNGAIYEFGFQAADAPAITGFVARAAELTYEPEVNVEATDGEGHVDSVTSSKPNQRTINGSFSGYITDQFDPETLSQSFTFDSRFYIIQNISQPRRKGEYVEVTITARSRAGVTS